MMTSTMIPLSEYLSTNYRPDRDWIEGELKERNLGEGPHSIVQSILIGLFRQFRQEWQVRVHTEQRVQTSESHYRIPDICVIRVAQPLERIVSTPPLLCIEILPRDDRMSEMQERVEDYLAMGVEQVWIIDPRNRTAFAADAFGMRPTEQLTVEGSAISIAVTEVFAELNALEAGTHP